MHGFLLRERHWGIRLDTLWFLAVLSAAVFLVSLVPLPPNDLWWHLKIGQTIAESAAIPVTNMFGWAVAPETPFIYGAWLGELLFYRFYELGGLDLVIFIRTLLYASTLMLVGIEARRRSR